MPNIGDWFVDAIALNENIDFTKILMCGLVYFLLFWLAICVWVYNDAKRRYAESDPRTPLLIAIGVFVLFFPALILYLAVRPHNDDLDWGGYPDGGVNIPVVNFVGEKGIEMTLELNIHPSFELAQGKPKDMKIDVEWKSDNEEMEVENEEKLSEKNTPDKGLWKKIDVFKENLKDNISKLKNNYLEKNKKKADEDEKEIKNKDEDKQKQEE